MATVTPIATLDADVIEALDFRVELRCEGRSHSTGDFGHAPQASAAYFMIAPCCGPKIPLCAARVAFMQERGTLLCSRCGQESIVERYIFLPIDSTLDAQ